MKLAISIDVPISEFWEMTPLELNLVAYNYSEKKKERRKEEIELAYLNAAWTIKWLGKKSAHPKPLQEILDNLYMEKKEMTDEDMLNQVKVLNRLFGGEEK